MGKKKDVRDRIRDLEEIPLDGVVDNPSNARTVFEGIEDLAKSITEIGLIEPVSVVETEPDRFRLVAGHRRVRAARLAGWTKIPAQILSVESDLDTVTENTARADLTPAELSTKLAALKAAGRTVKQIAISACLSEPHVRNLIRIREKACPELWTLYEGDREGGKRGETLTFKRAVELSALPHAAQRAAVARLLGEAPPNAGEGDAGEGDAGEGDAGEVEEAPEREPVRPRAVDRRTLAKYLERLTEARKGGRKDAETTAVWTTLRWVLGERAPDKPPIPWGEVGGEDA